MKKVTLTLTTDGDGAGSATDDFSRDGYVIGWYANFSGDTDAGADTTLAYVDADDVTWAIDSIGNSKTDQWRYPRALTAAPSTAAGLNDTPIPFWGKLKVSMAQGGAEVPDAVTVTIYYDELVGYVGNEIASNLPTDMGPSINVANYLTVTATFTSAAWNTVASHEIFTVTGLVRMRLWAEATGNVDSAGHAATIQLGYDGATDDFIGATDEEALVTGVLWYDTSPTLAVEDFSTAVFDKVVNGLDVGYEVAVEALTSGSVVFHCVWEPLNATGNVVAGTGVALA